MTAEADDRETVLELTNAVAHLNKLLVKARNDGLICTIEALSDLDIVGCDRAARVFVKVFRRVWSS